MNVREVMQALMDGKKVRKNSWFKNDFIELKNNMLLDEEGVMPNFYFQGDDWEIYEEYQMDFVEALAWMMESEKNVCKIKGGFCLIVKKNKIYSSLGNTHPSSYLWAEQFTSANDFLSLKFKKMKALEEPED